MNILWITNTLLPEATAKLKGLKEFKGSGGWMQGLSDVLCNSGINIKLSVAAISSLVASLTEIRGEKITFYVIPSEGDKVYNRKYEEAYRKINEMVHPDVVHIHGTEFPHTLAYINACGVGNVCVSIQGLVGAYSPYYHYGLTKSEIWKAVTPASLLRNGILLGYRDFINRAKYEEETIKRVNHIIGRTSWDRARTWALNPNAQYHHGGEILRSDFYKGEIWDYKGCIPHSIFISQAGYPIKGLHQVLRALPYILKFYPDTIIRIAGDDITRGTGFKELLKLSDWGNIIKKITKNEKINEHVVFLGPLNAEEMKREYLRSNVFVCPSSIENSPNSLGEAQILGVPVISSYVGGVMDMMKGDEDRMYRFEEIEMMAYKIVELFELKENVNTEPMRRVALLRHNPHKIVEDIVQVYKVVAQNADKK